jgi:peroxiredoxin
VRARIALVGVVAAAALLLSGCSSSGDALTNYGNQTNGNSTSFTDDSGQPVLVKQSDRKAALDFTSKTEDGSPLTLSDYRGKVVVVNFWYAGCAPCRAEAPILQGLYSTYQDRGAMFLGVNVVDQAPTAISFEKAHGVSYPSVFDSATGTARNAFSGAVSASTVPVTFVLDKKGRIAARIVGELQSKSILDTLITDTLAEKN